MSPPVLPLLLAHDTQLAYYSSGSSQFLLTPFTYVEKCVSYQFPLYIDDRLSHVIFLSILSYRGRDINSARLKLTAVLTQLTQRILARGILLYRYLLSHYHDQMQGYTLSSLLFLRSL